MMNSLFGTNPNTSFNSVSREQAIFTNYFVADRLSHPAESRGEV